MFNDVLLFSKVSSKKVKSVISEHQTTWYITEDGDLYGTGRNDSGEQGNGTSGTTTDVTTFTKRASNVAKVWSTYNTFSNTFYLTNDGELYGCGSNFDGIIPNGS